MQEAHIAKLQGAMDAGGDASLQNAMNVAVDSLKSIPPYGHREVLTLSQAQILPNIGRAFLTRLPTRHDSMDVLLGL